MTTTKRSWKLQEFVAHSANVTCLAIGPSSGRVMVTGGEDKKVNMWAIGKPNVILSLSGHNTPIECVQFNSSEELVCAGSQSGTLKIWDLEAAKIVRTLSGHKANIRSLDFHPYGDFVASGSIDTTVRLWDVRRKGCIVSYKGHTNAINHLRFSPDGRWVISAGEDGLVKLWDLNAGKLLADFTLHNGPVNRVEFHPREFLVATASSDRTVKFWDLETFALISTTDVEASSVRTICFHPEGLCLFSGGNDSLRAYSWEPMFCYDAQTLGWGKVSDMSFSSNQLIGASFQATNVSVWVASMNGLEEIIAKAASEQPLNEGVETTIIQTNEEGPQTRKISPTRKSFNTRPKTQSSKTRQHTPKDSPKEMKDTGLDDFTKVVDERLNNPNANVFKPKSNLSRSPPPVKKHSPPPPSKEENTPFGTPPNWQELQQAIQTKKSESDSESRPSSNTSVKNEHSAQRLSYQPPAAGQAPFEPPKMPVTKQLSSDQDGNCESYPVQYQPKSRGVSNTVHREQQQQPVQQAKVVQPTQRQQQAPVQQPQRQQQPPPVQQPQRQLPPQQDPPMHINDKLSALNLQDFAKVKDANLAQAANDEEGTLGLLKRSHVSLCQIMVVRLQNLALVSRLWTDGDIKAAVETASSMSDLSVLVDIMNVLTQKQALWTLDLCGAVLLPLKALFSSNYESYVETGSSSLKLIMKNFSPLIKSTLSTPPGALGVDLVREERYQKCEQCYRHLIEIRDVLNSRTKSPGRIGNLCKELSLALSVFD